MAQHGGGSAGLRGGTSQISGDLSHAAEAGHRVSRTLLNRFGVGDARTLASVYAVTTQPSKFDDHRED
jgi:hypothetical protein